MALCNPNSGDKLLRQMLDKFGINLLRPPRDNIAPGDLLVGDAGGQARLGDFKVIFGLDLDIRKWTDGAPEALTLNGSGKLASEAGAEVGGTLMAKLGLPTGSLRGFFSSHKSTAAEISIIAPSRRTLGNLDAVLAKMRDAKLAVPAIYKSRPLFMITDTFSALGMRIALYDASGRKISAEAKAAGELGAKADLKVTAEDNGDYGFRSKKPLVFGIAVRELEFGPEGVRDKLVKTVMTMRGAGQPDWQYVSKTEVFVSIED